MRLLARAWNRRALSSSWIPGSRFARPGMTGSGRSRAPQHKTARWFTPTGSIRRIHRRQAQEIFVEQAGAKDKIVEPIQQIHPTGKSP
jgi:hypothetical protein